MTMNNGDRKMNVRPCSFAVDPGMGKNNSFRRPQAVRPGHVTLCSFPNIRTTWRISTARAPGFTAETQRCVSPSGILSIIGVY